MCTHSTTLKISVPLVPQCIVFIGVPKVTLPVCLLPCSFIQHSRDSLIKEQHYLRAAALLAVRNALVSVLRQERKDGMPHTLTAAYPPLAYMAHAVSIAFNGVIVKHLVTCGSYSDVLQPPSFQR